MEFSKFAEMCEKIEKTSKRSEMIKTVADFLRSLPKNEVRPVCCMLLGKPFSALSRGIGWSSAQRAVVKVTGLKNQDLWKLFRKTGDFGEATRIAFERRRVLSPLLRAEPLTIEEVWKVSQKISETSGEGASERKERLLAGLLNRCSPTEAKFLIKMFTGEMRTGFKEGLLKSSIAQAFNMSEEEVERAAAIFADIGVLAERIAEKGKAVLAGLQLSLFQPVEPMLAQLAADVGEALSKHGGETSFEFKLDGARVQVHKKGRTVKIFSRSLSDVTPSLPEVSERVGEIRAEEAILDGEVIATDLDGDPLPFQFLLRRFRREKKIRKVMETISVRLLLFDVLYLNGQNMMNAPYQERRSRLLEIAPADCVVQAVRTSDEKEADEFLKEALERGHEGLVAKAPSSRYLPGARSDSWLKIKPVLEPLDLVIVGAEWGHGRRARFLSDYYLAALDEKTKKFEIVGKTFKGLSDEELEQMTEKLLSIKISEQGRVVWVKPEIVVEVLYNEIQQSPKYPCGMALRFARISRIREDKTAEQADTVQKIRSIFESRRRKPALEGGS